ncbi:unnamed protein product [Owenia fusiformis]|uniref:Uncharacterized protein n=1 Tax=Owenia fusiformis TaxID=6347 RepID=A0A8J1TWG5_OWEFU|nr:unnamed protein product [Owenia fusiformis]
MTDNIKVVVRVRPLIQRESGSKTHWVANNNYIAVKDKENDPKDCYYFDNVFDQVETTQDIYDTVAKPVVLGATAGFNGTMFAYGQTASGKTFTMSGSMFQPGIIRLALEDIFDTVQSEPNREYLIRMSFMEIYNERISDLLESDGSDANVNIQVLQDEEGGIHIAGLTENIIKSTDQALSYISSGEKRRHYGVTNMNERSSRSHTIFQVIIESKLREQMGEEEAVTVAQLNLVDLAGSENARDTGATGERLREGGQINKSLLMLGDVIRKLTEGEKHIPYRSSKLTRILQNALGGNSRTAIICNVTPAALDETKSTLRFASNAKKIKTAAKKNEVMNDQALLKRYKEEIEALKKHLEQDGITEIKSENNELRSQLLKQSERMEELKNAFVNNLNPEKEDSKPKKKDRRQTWCPGRSGRVSLAPVVPLSPSTTQNILSSTAMASPPSSPPLQWQNKGRSLDTRTKRWSNGDAIIEEEWDDGNFLDELLGDKNKECEKCAKLQAELDAEAKNAQNIADFDELIFERQQTLAELDEKIIMRETQLAEDSGKNDDVADSTKNDEVIVQLKEMLKLSGDEVDSLQHQILELQSLYETAKCELKQKESDFKELEEFTRLEKEMLEQSFSTQEKLEILKTEVSESEAKYLESKEAFERETEAKVKAAIEPFKSLPQEIESLQAVLDMRNQEIRDLKAKQFEVEKKNESRAVEHDVTLDTTVDTRHVHFQDTSAMDLASELAMAQQMAPSSGGLDLASELAMADNKMEDSTRDDSEEIIQSLKDDLKRSEKIIQDLTEKLNEITEQVNLNKDDLENNKQQIVEGENKIAEYGLKIAEYESKLEGHETMKLQFENLNIQLSEAQLELEILQSQQVNSKDDSSDGKLQQSILDVAHLESSIEKERRRSEVTLQEKEKVEKQLDFSKQHVEDLETVVKELQEEAEVMQKKLDAESQLLADATQQLNDALKQLEDKETQQRDQDVQDPFSGSDKRMYMMENRLKEEVKEHNVLREQYQKLVQESSQSKSKILCDENRDLDQQKRLKEVKNARQESIAQFAKTNKENSDLIEQLNKELHEVRCQLQKSKSEEEMASHKLLKYQDDIKNLQKEVRTLEDLHQEHHNNARKQEMNPDKMAQKIKQLSLNLDLTKQKMEKFELQNKTLQEKMKKCENAQFERNDLQRQLRDIQHYYEKEKEQHAIVRQNYVTVNGELAELRLTNTLGKEKLAQMEETIASQKAKLLNSVTDDDLEKRDTEKKQELEIQIKQMREEEKSTYEKLLETRTKSLQEEHDREVLQKLNSERESVEADFQQKMAALKSQIEKEEREHWETVLEKHVVKERESLQIEWENKLDNEKDCLMLDYEAKMNEMMRKIETQENEQKQNWEKIMENRLAKEREIMENEQETKLDAQKEDLVSEYELKIVELTEKIHLDEKQQWEAILEKKLQSQKDELQTEWETKLETEQANLERQWEQKLMDEIQRIQESSTNNEMFNFEVKLQDQKIKLQDEFSEKLSEEKENFLRSLDEKLESQRAQLSEEFAQKENNVREMLNTEKENELSTIIEKYELELSEKSSLNEMVLNKTEEIANLGAKFEELETQKLEVETQKIEIEILKDELEQQNTELISQVTDLKEQITTLNKPEEIANLEVKYEELETQKLEIETQKVEIEILKDELEQQNIELVSQIADLKKEMMTLKSENNDDAFVSLEERLGSKTEEFDKLQAEFEELQAHFKEYEIVLEEQKSKLENQKSEIIELQSLREKTSKLEDFEELITRNQELEQKLKQFETELHDLEVEKLKIEEENSKLKEQTLKPEELEILTAELNTVKEELSRVNQNLEDQQNQFNEATVKIYEESEERENGLRNEHSIELTRIRSEFEEKIAALTNENNAANAIDIEEDYKLQIQELKLEQEVILQELQARQERQLEAKENELKELKKTIEDAEAEHFEEKKHIIEAIEHAQELEIKLEEMSMELKNEKQTSAQALQQLKLLQESKSLSDTTKTLQEQLESQQLGNSETQRKLGEEQIKLQKLQLQLENQKKYYETDIKGLNAQIAKVQEVCEELDSQLEAEKSAHEKTMTQLKSKCKQIEEASAKYSERLKHMETCCEESDKELEEERLEHEKTKNQLKTKAKQMEDSQAKFRERLKHMEDCCEESDKELNEEKAQTTSLRKDLEQLEIKFLRIQVEQKGRNPSGATDENLKAKVNTMEQEIVEKNLKINRLETKLIKESWKEELAAKEDDIRYLREQVKTANLKVRQLREQLTRQDDSIMSESNQPKVAPIKQEPGSDGHYGSGSGAVSSTVIYTLEAKIMRLERDNKALKIKCDTLQKEYSKYKDDYDKKNKENTRLKSYIKTSADTTGMNCSSTQTTPARAKPTSKALAATPSKFGFPALRTSNQNSPSYWDQFNNTHIETNDDFEAGKDEQCKQQ